MTTKRTTALALRRALQRKLEAAAVDADGWTDLHYAAALDLPGCVSALMVRGAAVDARLKGDAAGIGTALAVLAPFGVGSSDLHREGETPLHIAASTDAAEAAAVLLDHGADVEARLLPLERDAALGVGDEGDLGPNMRPLHIAAEHGATRTAQVLIGRGADIHAKDYYGRSPLHHAAFCDSTDTMACLVDGGADVDAAGKGGITPLHTAAVADSKAAVAFLVEHGADINARAGLFGTTPLDATRVQDAVNAAGVLRSHGGETFMDTHEVVNHELWQATPELAFARFVVREKPRPARHRPGKRQSRKRRR